MPQYSLGMHMSCIVLFGIGLITAFKHILGSTFVSNTRLNILVNKVNTSQCVCIYMIKSFFCISF